MTACDEECGDIERDKRILRASPLLQKDVPLEDYVALLQKKFDLERELKWRTDNWTRSLETSQEKLRASLAECAALRRLLASGTRTVLTEPDEEMPPDWREVSWEANFTETPIYIFKDAETVAAIDALKASTASA